MDSNIQQRQITVEEYYQMGAHGIIGPEERTQSTTAIQIYRLVRMITSRNYCPGNRSLLSN